MTVRALVVEADAANRLSFHSDWPDDWLVQLAPLPDGVVRVEHGQFTYLIGAEATKGSRLLTIPADSSGVFSSLAASARLECFQRVLRAALSQFRPGLVKLPLGWRIFHSASLISFQSNRKGTGLSARVYVDVAPEGTAHVYAFHISNASSEPLSRIGYDEDLFVDTVLGFEDALAKRPQQQQVELELGHTTIALTTTFNDEANITGGIPFAVWRDAKLIHRQREFFDAAFDGPLRVKGPAGSGKTLVMTMRFLKEIYLAMDRGNPVRACFLSHGEETSEQIVRYLTQIDERGIFTDPGSFPLLDIEVTTLHGLANRYINRDTENVQPLSLDGTDGRKMQFELIESLIRTFVTDDWNQYKSGCRPDFVAGMEAQPDYGARRAFCYDLSDEFANVLETFGVRGIDEISQRYAKAGGGVRALAKNVSEKRVVMELYRRFRAELGDLGIVSLDQFTADFLAYLNSFRWQALRRERGFDFVFADELHLFNSQERRVLGFLLKDAESPPRVAVAYDPRQSPRNTFFPEATTERDTVWTEAKLESSVKPFELSDVFRYTPQILVFLDRLNQQFPATDLAEDWSISFGKSVVADGPKPCASEWAKQVDMVVAAVDRAKKLAKSVKSGEHVAVLCLDHERFAQYTKAGAFSEFVVVGGRDELGAIQRFRTRVVLSMPEYVAGLQFSTVFLLDVNADLVTELGGGVNGLHRLISGIYLGASRAKTVLEIYADKSAGGFAEPIRRAIDQNLVTKLQ